MSSSFAFSRIILFTDNNGNIINNILYLLLFLYCLLSEEQCNSKVINKHS